MPSTVQDPMIRRDFLRRLAVGAFGLLVADDVLELIVGSERRFWPGAEFMQPDHFDLMSMLTQLTHDIFGGSVRDRLRYETAPGQLLPRTAVGFRGSSMVFDVTPPAPWTV